MKTFTIKTKRDGQGWNETGFIYASSWQEAKRIFSDNIRNDISTDCGYIYIDSPEDAESYPDIDYNGAGFYSLDISDNVLDSDCLSTYRNDVYTYTICRV